MSPQTGPPPSRCDEPLPDAAREGIERFNRREFFEAHESLEHAWRAERGPERKLYHGVLQLAVAWHHIGHGSYRGARHALARAQHWLAGFPTRCQGVDVAAVRAQVTALEQELERVGPANLAHVDRRLCRPIWPDGQSHS
jgi:predicted metal-dependent hydrolase